MASGLAAVAGATCSAPTVHQAAASADPTGQQHPT